MTEVLAALTAAHKDFLLSLVQAEPDWNLLPFNHLRALPALKWKLQNLEKLKTRNRKRFEFQSAELKHRF